MSTSILAGQRRNYKSNNQKRPEKPEAQNKRTRRLTLYDLRRLFGEDLDTSAQISALGSPIPQKKRKPKKPTQYKALLSFLLDHISPMYVGEKTERGIRALNLNSQIVEFLEGRRRYLPNRLSGTMLADHCAGIRTNYFVANSRKGMLAMIGIDVDCKRRGSLDGAMAFLKHLSETDFPNLYYEPSTNGRGGHGYFLLDIGDLGAEAINVVLLKQLSPYLNEVAEGFDVEFIEIKGTLPVIDWGDEKGKVDGFKQGVPFKLPRQAAERFDELKNTTIVQVNDLRRLPSTKVVTPRLAKNDCGSMQGVLVTKKNLAGLDRMGCYRRSANHVLQGEVLRCSGRVVVTRDDLAIEMMLVDVFSDKMNADGTMPWARIKAMWDLLYKNGEVSRCFDNKRHSRMVKILVAAGLIDVKDKTYVRPERNKDGERIKKGRAMKWRASCEFYALLDWARGITPDAVVASATLGGNNPFRAIILDDLILSFTPTAVAAPVEWRPSPEELDQYITFFEVAA